MDPIYYSAPRPYNKYPHGYRPVQESEFAIRRLRPSSSWSSFPQTFDDQHRSNTLPHFPSELASPKNSIYSNSTQDDFRFRKPHRTESFSTFDQYNIPTSPRELSPLSTASEYCNNPPPPPTQFQSPVQQEPMRCYDNVPRPPSESLTNSHVSSYPTHPTYPTTDSKKEQEFLHNLRENKKEMMSSSWYGPDQNHQAYQPPEYLNERQPRRLTKTRSDVLIDTRNAFDGFDAPPTLSNSHKLDGFFRNKMIEPSWMTDPPPPKSFRDDYIIRYNSAATLPISPVSSFIPNSSPNSHSNSNIERFSYSNNETQNQTPNQVPSSVEFSTYTIPRERRTRSYHQDSNSNDSFYPDSARDRDFSSYRLSHWETTPVRSPPFQPNQLNQSNQQQQSAHPPSNFHSYSSQITETPVQLNNRNFLPAKDEYRRDNVYQNVPTNYSTTYQERDRMVLPNAHQHESSFSTIAQPPRTPLVHSTAREFARLTSPVRETIVDVHHTHAGIREHDQPQLQQNHRETPNHHRETPSYQNSNHHVYQNVEERPSYYKPALPRASSPNDRIFSPVESKVYNRYQPTVINGFTNSMHPEHRQHEQPPAEEYRNPHRSFQPPIAVIEPNINVPMPSDPIQYYKPHLGSGGHREQQRQHQVQQHQHQPQPQPQSQYHQNNQHQNQRQQPPYQDHHHPQNLRRKPDATFENSTFVQSSNRQTFSPVSNSYETEIDSDLDIEEMARKVLPRYLRNQNSNGRKSNIHGVDLQGILIKNPSLHRNSSKKVVFIDQERGSGGSSSGDVPAHVRAYDDALEGAISNWSNITDQIGGDMAAIKPKVLQVFEELRNYLWKAAGMAEPSAEETQKMLTPIVQTMNEISEFKSAKNRSPHYNHLSAVSEGLPGVGWVAVKKTPAPHVKDYIEASMFFVNRILKEFKETDPRHVEWTKAWKEIFEEMHKFVRQTHTTGLVWNSAPGSAPAGGSSAPPPKASGPPAPKSGGPPPPPPPPIPADLFANLPPVSSSSADKDKANRDALFAALNKGDAVTSGLKKVTADMQTHKNPNLRAGSAVPSTLGPAGASAPRQAAQPAQPVRKPAKKELQDGKQWNVEYFVNDKNIVIDVADKKQTIYIFRCEGCVIKVNGKANSITLDGCKKTSIVFDALVAQCETINCQSMQIQTLGELPTLSIQKTDGCQVYLSKVAQGAEIITSKSSEMNISIQTTEDGDYSEYPVPEQFKTTFVNGKLVTTVSDIC